MKKPAPFKTGIARLAAAAALSGVALLAGTNLWTVVKAAWADAGSLSAHDTITHWRDGAGPTMTKQNWEGNRDQLLNSLATSPGNAQVLDDLAFLYAVRARNLANAPPDSPANALRQSLLDQAIVYYRAACSLRPTFPYTWTNLALAKYNRGQQDAEFWNAFDRALHYGHSDAALQPDLVLMAFPLWSTLGAERQQAIGAMVANAKSANQPALRAMAQRAGVVLPN